ncbi:uncharacterized protein H6S33_001752 [Morchella sextelata]|uniref:uncharacterized protein n=1 Tax=Morchella sextelata TaxID=1174677 RepID=UPI001D03A890|nr:uncharacterized protein H6S33_001752 [Morchella sextelata]KAH0608618.1 hypothetical protein H6S33_001752 [Morchella sextelata]
MTVPTNQISFGSVYIRCGKQIRIRKNVDGWIDGFDFLGRGEEKAVAWCYRGPRTNPGKLDRSRIFGELDDLPNLCLLLILTVYLHIITVAWLAGERLGLDVSRRVCTCTCYIQHIATPMLPYYGQVARKTQNISFDMLPSASGGQRILTHILPPARHPSPGGRFLSQAPPASHISSSSSSSYPTFRARRPAPPPPPQATDPVFGLHRIMLPRRAGQDKILESGSYAASRTGNGFRQPRIRDRYHQKVIFSNSSYLARVQYGVAASTCMYLC